ncbi:hypothetical protein [Bacillus toyonensis]|uniref:hypothetical protein n=1 Tax=Bacillus toyonensis TaxID=155322 RepID=UPI000BEC1DA7|nr:hypothetical protein [Bacillus toyonensis]PEC65027.1 hypothetical protein CON62_23920 [Bacillus toyonensis]
MPSAAGVFGTNNGAKGVGFQGNGTDTGVSGFSEQVAGVHAHSNNANALEGFEHNTNGSALKKEEMKVLGSNDSDIFQIQLIEKRV